jgi:hypothetical protein
VAVRDLAQHYLRGSGGEPNFKVAAELIKLLLSIKDPEADILNKWLGLAKEFYQLKKEMGDLFTSFVKPEKMDKSDLELYTKLQEIFTYYKNVDLVNLEDPSRVDRVIMIFKKWKSDFNMLMCVAEGTKKKAIEKKRKKKTKKQLAESQPVSPASARKLEAATQKSQSQSPDGRPLPTPAVSTNEVCEHKDDKKVTAQDKNANDDQKLFLLALNEALSKVKSVDHSESTGTKAVVYSCDDIKKSFQEFSKALQQANRDNTDVDKKAEIARLTQCAESAASVQVLDQNLPKIFNEIQSTYINPQEQPATSSELRNNNVLPFMLLHRAHVALHKKTQSQCEHRTPKDTKPAKVDGTSFFNLSLFNWY